MTVKKRLITDSVIGVLLFFITAIRRRLFDVGELQDIFGVLSDCFVIPGVILLGLGLLSFTREKGIFDMLTYSLSKPYCTEDYFNYKCRRRENDAHYKNSLVIGIAFLTAGTVFLAIYLIL